MPTWLWIHGIIIIIWVIFWGAIYYFKFWTLSFPFKKMTSIKIIFSLYLPLSWLLSSLLIGVIIVIVRQQSVLDNIFLILFPLIALVLMSFYYGISYFLFRKSENQLQTNIRNFRDTCQKWILQFPFIDESKYDLQVFVSKDRPVGRMVIYELTFCEEKALKAETDKLPIGLTLLFSRK